MANLTYFIDETYFKANTPVNLSVDPYLINMSINDAQEMHVQMQLGSILYKKLVTLIRTLDIQLPANAVYKTLLDDYVQPAVVQWAMYECIPYLRYKLMNKGIQLQNSDNSTSADLEDLKYIEARVKDRAEFVSQRLADYLLENYTLFPEYTAATDIDDIKPETDAYNSGMFLGQRTDACKRSMGFNDGIIYYSL